MNYSHVCPHKHHKSLLFSCLLLPLFLGSVIQLWAEQPYLPEKAGEVSPMFIDQTPYSGIQLFPGNSQEFEVSFLEASDAKSLAAIDLVRPYSVLVKNNTNERVVSVTIRFYLTDVTGRTVWHQMTAGTRVRTNSSMIAPGDSVLLTPITGLNTVLHRGRQKHVLEDSSMLPEVSKRARQYSEQARIRVSIDSVIFEDGGMVGSDVGGNLEMLNAWSRAEQEISDSLQALHSEDIRSFLSSLRDMPRGKGQNHHEKRLHDFAEELLSQVDSFSTQAEFLAYVRGRALSRIPIITRRGL